jgi:GTP-binding protein
MIVNNVTLEKVGVKKEQFPETGLPEIAFCGKSNVGKSSLINGLINRKSLARTSGQPGKTQTVNFYNVENQLYFVDLPGYGYAKVSKTSREIWARMINKYLSQREELKLVACLVDIRHEPSANDKMMVDWVVAEGFKPLVIATKADKLKRSQISKHVSMIKKGLELEDIKQVIPFSATTKQGKDEIWKRFEEILALGEGKPNEE